MAPPAVLDNYDQFVSAVAGSSAPLAALGTSWQAIASTSSVTAFSHIGGAFSTPVYRLDGLLVANDSSDLWDLSLARPVELDELARPLYRNDNPDYLGVSVWTGTRYGGNAMNSPIGYEGTRYPARIGGQPGVISDGIEPRQLAARSPVATHLL